MKTRYYLGIDAGGTKTHALIADETGQAAGFGRAGTGSQQAIGYEAGAQSLRTAIQHALQRAGLRLEQISAAGFGMAGYDWPSQLPPHQEMVASLGLTCPLEIVNDAVIALLAGAEQGWGVGIIAGTGNNVRGRDRFGREGRITGEGMLFGEVGGSGELVALSIRAITYEWTRRGPQTAITQKFIAQSGASGIADWIEGVDLGRYPWGAHWAPLVVEAAQEGDAVAQDLLAYSGRELAENANAVIRQLDMQNEAFEVVLAGSLFKSGDLLIAPLRRTLLAFAPHARLVALSAPPVVGAVVLAMQQEGAYQASLCERLQSSTQRLKQALGE
jgi:N-acetylglucosamine kinase-like BadF-type ATPase